MYDILASAKGMLEAPMDAALVPPVLLDSGQLSSGCSIKGRLHLSSMLAESVSGIVHSRARSRAIRLHSFRGSMAQTSGIRGSVRAARALCYLLVWIVYLQLPTVFAENIERLIVNVSEVADGSVTQARVEAARRAVNQNLGYRSTRKEDNLVFSGVYTSSRTSCRQKGALCLRTGFIRRRRL